MGDEKEELLPPSLMHISMQDLMALSAVSKNNGERVTVLLDVLSAAAGGQVEDQREDKEGNLLVNFVIAGSFMVLLLTVVGLNCAINVPAYIICLFTAILAFILNGPATIASSIRHLTGGSVGSNGQ